MSEIIEYRIFDLFCFCCFLIEIFCFWKIFLKNAKNLREHFSEKAKFARTFSPKNAKFT